jgi:hypothetical protein
MRVQRLFSMFPPGLPGLALLLLRASVVAAVLLEVRPHLPGWATGASVLLSIWLCAGYLTPVAAGVAFVFHAVVWLYMGIDSIGVGVIATFDALALALLGPGAYSIDSYRFGRRVVLLPPD